MTSGYWHGRKTFDYVRRQLITGRQTPRAESSRKTTITRTASPALSNQRRSRWHRDLVDVAILDTGDSLYDALEQMGEDSVIMAEVG